MNFLRRSCCLRPDTRDDTSAAKRLSHPVLMCPPQAVCNLQPLLCHVHFLDGSVKAIAIDPAETVASIMRRIQQMIQLQDIHGWALYEVRLSHVMCCCHGVLQGGLWPQSCVVCVVVTIVCCVLLSQSCAVLLSYRVYVVVVEC